MSEIPKDIHDAAWAAFKEGEYDNGARVHHIALAILAEREACAKIAEEYSHGIYAAEAIRER